MHYGKSDTGVIYYPEKHGKSIQRRGGKPRILTFFSVFHAVYSAQLWVSCYFCPYAYLRYY